MCSEQFPQLLASTLFGRGLRVTMDSQDTSQCELSVCECADVVTL
jgi:hypothetical protein